MPIFNNKDIDFGYGKTRIGRDYSARVLIPLENFKLPVLDVSFFSKDTQVNVLGSAVSIPAGRIAKAELNATINNLISKIKVRWHSGRKSSGELNIRDATQVALQASVMDRHITSKEKIRMSLTVSCRDVAGENCFEGNNATVLWAGTLIDIDLEAPPLQEITHSFALYFLVPGEYTLLAAAVINDATDVLRARVLNQIPQTSQSFAFTYTLLGLSKSLPCSN